MYVCVCVLRRIDIGVHEDDAVPKTDVSVELGDAARAPRTELKAQRGAASYGSACFAAEAAHEGR